MNPLNVAELPSDGSYNQYPVHGIMNDPTRHGPQTGSMKDANIHTRVKLSGDIADE